MSGPRGAELRYAFATVLLKLNCYHDFLVFRGQREKSKRNPKPEKLEKWVARNQDHLCIAPPLRAGAYRGAHQQHLYGAVYPTTRLLKEIRALAAANGLFVWRPDES